MMKRRLAKMNDTCGHRKITIDDIKIVNGEIYLSGHDQYNDHYLWTEDADGLNVSIGETRLFAFDEEEQWMGLDDEWKIVFDNEFTLDEKVKDLLENHEFDVTTNKYGQDLLIVHMYYNNMTYDHWTTETEKVGVKWNTALYNELVKIIKERK